MRVGLLWTISDYPGLAMLSGWSTKGKLACPTCQEDTRHQRLKHGRKTCYMGHRRFLPMGHRFRSLTKEFNGNVEYGSPPNPLLGPDILQKLKHIPHVFGKQFEDSLMGDRPRKRKERASNTATSNMPGNWKKFSIFYELPYWADNVLKHNLDVTHTEKNVCDSVIGTLLDMDKKAKDGLKARLDLQLLNLRPELHPIMTANGKKFFLPNACYFMDNAKKEMFLSVLKNLKTLDGYSSLIARCVNMKQRKIFGLKSHDSHVIMQQLLLLAIRKTLPDRVSSVLIELSSFFQELCSKNSRPKDFKELEKRIALILCNLEKIFPPAFFDIMVHLLIHLPTEARIGGPVQYRWMYPIKRYLYTLKKYVRNKAHPEGSIAEGYLADECVTFLSRYLKDVESRINRQVRYVDDTHIMKAARIVLSGNQKKLLHDYILFNDANVDTYAEQHKATLAMLHPKMNQRQRQRKHKNEFADWFRDHIMLLGQAKLPFAEGLDVLAEGPFTTARRFTGYTTRGYSFRTVSKDSRAKTQNSGIVVESTAPFYRNAADQNPNNDTELTYYGQVKDIIELTYRQGRKFVLFECDWFDVVSGSG
ncbi:uncharacterized protein LOC113296573 [Papaver somniferum]|uniref:uncharacterized protein LOC113296573 n=1 Tax=Papaver somniferum TaxID=3469 RepID=UPI000E6F7092|nr:uncharacterized protein LOC113296573 [Papaver somniferum]